MTIDQRDRFTRIRAEMAASRYALVEVLRSPDLRRVQLAYVGYNVARWASFIAISVYAFQIAGAAGVGMVAVVQLVPAAMVAPFAAVLGDRYRRERVLQVGYAIEVLAVGLLATSLIADTPSWVVFVLASGVGISFSLVRPVHESLVPLIARSPSETTAGYVVGGMISNLSAVVGPLLAALVLAMAGPGAVYAVLFFILLVSTLIVGRLVIRTEPASAFEEGTHVIAEAVRGFELMIKHPGQRVLLLMLAGGRVVLGLLDILIVVLAFEVFGTGETGTGVLNAALGIGGIVGAVGTLALIGKSSLAGIAGNGMLLYGLPIAVIAIVDQQSLAFLALVAAGTGSALADVSGRVMLQRVAPNEALSRVFGVVESSWMAGEAAGAVLGAVLVANVGITATLVLSGLFLPALWLVRRHALNRADVGMQVAPEIIELLRGLTMFQAVGPVELERIAALTTQVRAPEGTVVVAEGDHGDQFYIIAGGTALVTKGGRQLATLERGEYFGEIALVRDVPRTATVTAATKLDMVAIGRTHFVEAVVPHTASACSIEEFIDQRLAAHGD